MTTQKKFKVGDKVIINGVITEINTKESGDTHPIKVSFETLKQYDYAMWFTETGGFNYGQKPILFHAKEIVTVKIFGKQEFNRAIELCKKNLRASSNVAHQSEIFDNLKIK